MISVVQDIICPSNFNNDRQQTIDALFGMVPNTNIVEERPSGDGRSSLWKISFLAKKIISFGLSNPVLLILHVRSLLVTLQFSVAFTATGLQVQSLPPPGDTKKISKLHTCQQIVSICFQVNILGSDEQSRGITCTNRRV